MSRENVLAKVNEIFHEVFDDDNIVVKEEMTAADIKGWDSLRHITLIEEIEDVFDIRFAMKEVNGMKNVGEMIDIIVQRSK